LWISLAVIFTAGDNTIIYVLYKGEHKMRIIQSQIELNNEGGYVIGSTKEASLWHSEGAILTELTAYSAGLQLVPNNGIGIGEDAEEWLSEWVNEDSFKYVDKPIPDFADAMYEANSALKLFGVSILPGSVRLLFICPDSPMISIDNSITYGQYSLTLKPGRYEFVVFVQRKGSKLPDRFSVTMFDDYATDIIEYRNGEERSRAHITQHGDKGCREVMMYLEEYD